MTGALARLWRIGAVPAQRLAAWRAAGDALAGLDRAVAVGDDDAVLGVLLQAPQADVALAAVLERLDASAPRVEPQPAELTRRRLGSGAPPPAATRDPDAAVGAVSTPRSAARVMPRAAVLRSTPSAHGPAANPAALPWLQAARRRAQPAVPVQDADASAGRAAGGATHQWPQGLLARPVPLADDRVAASTLNAADATARIAARAARAGLASAWQQVVSAAPLAALDADAGSRPVTVMPAVNPGVAIEGSQDPAARSALGGSPVREPGATASVIPLVGASDPLDPGLRLQARIRSPSGGPAVPLQAARIGGFKGLAALGHAHGPPGAQPNPLTPPPTLPEPLLDPQSLVDRIAAALREQAARSGITIDGLGEP